MLVVTADDFGIDESVNEAVEIAHRRGFLTAASLMVGGKAVADAVTRARRLPALGIGLHLDLVEGRPISPPDRVPDLVASDGRFRRGLAWFGFAIAMSSRVRTQLRTEIDAQFEAFEATGLPFDHVNAHRHFHVHPVVAGMVLNAASRHGVPALRAPVEPGRPRGSGWLAAPFARSLQRRARRRGVLVPDRVFGLAATGRMTAAMVCQSLARVRPGVNELYLHPATRDDFEGHGPGYHHRAELQGLIDERCIAAIRASDIRLGSFRELLRRRP